MYLLYLDDAGSVGNAADKHFVLAGIALFERQIHFLDKDLHEAAMAISFFVDSQATRAVQYADMVAYALWRHYEKGDSEFFAIIEPAFDVHAGVRHGLCIQSLPTTNEMT